MPSQNRRGGDARQPQRGQAERDEEDHEQGRHAAEQVGVEHRQRADREQHRRDRAAGDRDQHADDQDQRLGDQEHPHVDPERRRDRRERVPRVRPGQERRLDPRPARRGGQADDEQHEHHDRRTVGDQPGPVVEPAPDPEPLDLPGAGGPVGHCRTGTSTTSDSHCFSMSASLPESFSEVSAWSTQGVELAALLEEHPELLLLAGLRLELADDRALRDLHGGDVERRRQVGEDRVDLAVEQRLLGLVGVVEDQRLRRRLDHVGDRGQRRRTRLGAELEVLAGRRAR